MKSDEKVKKTKQPYEKPRLRTIELAAEEVLATGCKVAGSGTFNVGAVECGIGNNCSQNGS